MQQENLQKSVAKKISLDTVIHKGMNVVLIKFPYDNELISIVKKLNTLLLVKHLNRGIHPTLLQF